VAPNSLIKADLFPNPSVPYDDIRRLAELAAAEHLSFFGTGASALATRESLPRTTYTPLLTAVRLPKEGAVLRGSVFLNASATGDYPITGLQFLISAAGGEPLQRLPATQFRYGYLGAWHTTNVSNGSYTIESIAWDSAGQTRTSRPLSVTVAN
jgi:hypothetical protein